MILTFDRKTVEELLQHSANSAAWRPTFEGAKSQKPGLWLVGDRGVYLMSNGDPGKLLEKTGNGGPGKETHHVCYADQVDPGKLPADEWLANKRASFGGDDGCDFLAADKIKTALKNAGSSDKIALRVTSKYIEVATPPRGR